LQRKRDNSYRENSNFHGKKPLAKPRHFGYKNSKKFYQGPQKSQSLKLQHNQAFERPHLDQSKSPQAMTTPNWPGHCDEEAKEISQVEPLSASRIKSHDEYWSFDEGERE
jgi:hypothetical protein